MPTAFRTAACSASTPAPAYSSGIDQPPNAANLAPASRCRSCSGEVISSSATALLPPAFRALVANLPQPAGRLPCSRPTPDHPEGPLDCAHAAAAFARHCARASREPSTSSWSASPSQAYARCPNRSRAPSRSRYGMSVAEMAPAWARASRPTHRRTLPAAGRGPRIVVVGFGADDPTPEDLRRAAGAGVRQAAGLADGRPLSVAVSLGTGEPEEAQAVAEGALLGSYRYTPISSGQDSESKVGSLTVVHPPRGGSAEITDGGRAGGGGRRDRPRLGEHAGQSALSGVIRRLGPPAGREHPDRRRRARRHGAEPRRLRRAAGRRRRLVAAAAAGPARVPAARGEVTPGAGRQRHHLRHRRPEPQAGRGHVHDEVRHGRGRRRVRRDRSDRPSSDSRSTSPRTARWRRTCRHPPRTGRPTSSRCTAARPWRTATPTPRAGW